MKVIGIEIKGTRLNVVVLERQVDGSNVDITGKAKCFELENEHEPTSVRGFMNVLHRHFDSINPVTIGILKRNANAVERNVNGTKFRPPSPLSFKLEGLIQLYPKIDPVLVAPQTISAYLKKNTGLIIQPQYNYQQKPYELCLYLLK